MISFRDNPFRPAPDVSLYQQLYDHLRAAILSGQLKGGLKLPYMESIKMVKDCPV